MSLRYSDYLKIHELLSLQQPKGQSHDEWLFIITHQVYELWFTQFLREGEHLAKIFKEGTGYLALDTLKRMLKIVKITVSQTDILETLSFKSFNSFRDILESSSGLQSYQFREVEAFLGWKNTRLYQALSPKEREYVEKRLEQPSLWDCFCDYARKNGADIPQSKRNDGEALAYVPNKDLQRGLLELVNREPAIGLITELLIDLDEGFQEWRYRHIKMVERTIGDSEGTGGSSGLNYLKKSLYKQAFPDLWQMRNIEEYG